MTEIRLLYLLNVYTVVSDGSVLYLIKSVDKVSNGGLTCTGSANESHLLARAGKDIDTMKHRMISVIGEVNVLKDHISLKLSVLSSTVILNTLPCPGLCTLGRLCYLTIHFLCMNQCNSSIILFRDFIHKGEDTVDSRETHDNSIDLLGNTAYLAGKLLFHVKERNGNAYAESHTA